ncbi:hypothetical protein [Oceanicoccus sp. KOV_DT_Chl]|uniref:hypothetical protein n=1 Tax=Oceanicoccus sp. KOV_DT_Chl TaxID=1904639 RepID=UPI00190E6933|nr:hypothetical protein [Oceanicoccus sp. KOV_DT_Chl]
MLWLRTTLRKSQQEAVASSTMTATSDHFFIAYAVYLQASMGQMALLTGLPQLFGAAAQLFSVWFASHFVRKRFISMFAFLQALVVLAMAVGAIVSPSRPVWVFISLCVAYQVCLNLIQPHWRAWMGSVVPERRRGTFLLRVHA